MGLIYLPGRDWSVSEAVFQNKATDKKDRTILVDNL